jgi:hypothetical protein
VHGDLIETCGHDAIGGIVAGCLDPLIRTAQAAILGFVSAFPRTDELEIQTFLISIQLALSSLDLKLRDFPQNLVDDFRRHRGIRHAIEDVAMQLDGPRVAIPQLIQHAGNHADDLDEVMPVACSAVEQIPLEPFELANQAALGRHAGCVACLDGGKPLLRACVQPGAVDDRLCVRARAHDIVIEPQPPRLGRQVCGAKLPQRRLVPCQFGGVEANHPRPLLLRSRKLLAHVAQHVQFAGVRSTTVHAGFDCRCGLLHRFEKIVVACLGICDGRLHANDGAAKRRCLACARAGLRDPGRGHRAARPAEHRPEPGCFGDIHRGAAAPLSGELLHSIGKLVCDGLHGGCLSLPHE